MGKKIKAYREARKLTQQQVATAAGVTIGAVSQWENGRCGPSAVALLRIAKFFGCDPDELVDEDEKFRDS